MNVTKELREQLREQLTFSLFEAYWLSKRLTELLEYSDFSQEETKQALEEAIPILQNLSNVCQKEREFLLMSISIEDGSNE